MSEFEHQPGEDGAATPGETSPLEQRRRAIKAALIAGPFVATLSSGRAMAGTPGCSTQGGCTSVTQLKTDAPEETPPDAVVEPGDTNGTGSEPGTLPWKPTWDQQAPPERVVLKKATDWELPKPRP